MDVFCDDEAFSWLLMNPSRGGGVGKPPEGTVTGPSPVLPTTNQELVARVESVPNGPHAPTERTMSYMTPNIQETEYTQRTVPLSSMPYPVVNPVPSISSIVSENSTPNHGAGFVRGAAIKPPFTVSPKQPVPVPCASVAARSPTGALYTKNLQEPVTEIKPEASAASTTARTMNLSTEKLEKLERRRARNRASARASRTRRLTREEDLCKRLKQLESENYDLKMRLKIGKEALNEEKREKKQCIEAMMTLLKENRHTHRNNETEMQHLINLYKHSYAEYGAKKKEKIAYHLKKIRQLLLPTGITNISFLSVEEGKGIIHWNSTKQDGTVCQNSHIPPSNVTDLSTAPSICSDGSVSISSGYSSTADCLADIYHRRHSPTKISRENLWEVLVKELDVTEEQQQELLAHQPIISRIKKELEASLDILNRLKTATEQKNIALEKQIDILQNILTPTQTSKFIIWIKQNPAFMYMLDKLVDSSISVVPRKSDANN